MGEAVTEVESIFDNLVMVRSCIQEQQHESRK
jgi:hypothetical protein